MLKVRAQVNRQESLKYRKAIPLIIRHEGISGLWKGFMPNMLGTPGTGIYFCTYEYIKRHFKIEDDMELSK